MKFHVWDPDDGDESETGRDLEADDPRAAAQVFADTMRDAWDCAWPRTFHVRAPDRALYSVEVEQRETVSYHAGVAEVVDAATPEALHELLAGSMPEDPAAVHAERDALRAELKHWRSGGPPPE